MENAGQGQIGGNQGGAMDGQLDVILVDPAAPEAQIHQVLEPTAILGKISWKG
jgi:hypothetical protein